MAFYFFMELHTMSLSSSIGVGWYLAARSANPGANKGISALFFFLLSRLQLYTYLPPSSYNGLAASRALFLSLPLCRSTDLCAVQTSSGGQKLGDILSVHSTGWHEAERSSLTPALPYSH